VEDYALLIATTGVLTAVALVAWRFLGGPALGAGRRLLRIVVSVAAALAVTGAAAYELMNARSFQLGGELVPRVETDAKVVALTLDDGPTPEYTAWVLDVLERHDVTATFYLSGKESEENPAALRAIIAAEHELGNHTYDGRRLVFLSRSTVTDEIERTDAVFRAAGYSLPTTIRPPGCKKLLTAPPYFASAQRTTVTWDLEPDSIAEIAEDADAMVDYVVRGVRPGSIVLLHPMYETRESSREALPRIIEALTDDGYRFVTVSQLLALRDQE